MMTQNMFVKNGKWKALALFYLRHAASIQLRTCEEHSKEVLRVLMSEKSMESHFSSHPTENFSSFDSTNGNFFFSVLKLFCSFLKSHLKEIISKDCTIVCARATLNNHPWNLSVMEKNQLHMLHIVNSISRALWYEKMLWCRVEWFLWVDWDSVDQTVRFWEFFFGEALSGTEKVSQILFQLFPKSHCIMRFF